jgi:hypothetical protein
MQELRQTLFDFFGFCLWSGEPEQGVVGLWGPLDYADRGVMLLACGVAGPVWSA